MPRKGYKPTKEHKQKVKHALLRHVVSKKTKEKIKQSRKGKCIGDKNPTKRPEVREKLRQARLGKKNSKESKEKNRQAHLGKKASEATKKKLRDNHKGTMGMHWKLSEMTKEKLRGKNNHNWIDGRSALLNPYSVDWTLTLRKSIRQRDKYTCQICGKEPAICVHHIDYNKKNCNSDNLITLCRSCHTKTNHKREYWIDYFKNIQLWIKMLV